MTRGARILVIASGLAIAAAAACIVYRAPLLGTLLRSVAAVRGIPAPRLTVESVGWRATAIVGLALGAEEEVRARRVVVDYEPGDLLAGRVRAVALEGLTLKLDLRGDGPPLGTLQTLAAGEESASGADPPMPPIALSDARIEALTPLGPVSGRLEGTLRPGPEGALEVSARFALEAEAGRLNGTLDAARTPDGKTAGTLTLSDGALTLPGAELRGLRGAGAFNVIGTVPETASLALTLGEVALPGASFEQARLAVRLADTRLELDAEMATADGELTLRASAGLEDFPASPEGEVRLVADIGAQAFLWSLLALPAPAAGRIEATVTAQGQLPPEDFAGRVTLRLSGLDYPGLVEGLSGRIRLEASATGVEKLSGTATLALTAARLRQGDIRAGGVALEQTFVIQAIDEKVSLTSSNNGEISVKKLTYGSLLTSEGPLSARIAAAAATLDLGAPEGLGLVHDVTLAVRPVKIAVLRDGAAPLPVRGRAKQVRAAGAYLTATGYAGRIEIEDGSIAVPQYELAGEGLDAKIDLGRDGRTGVVFEIAALRHTADPPVAAPLALRGEVRQSGAGVAFSATGSGPNGVGEIGLSGQHRTTAAGAAGEARLELAPLVFTPGGAQPAALFPALAELRNVAGRARAEVGLSWGPGVSGGLAGTAALRIEDLSLDSAAARIEGLSLDLNLSQLQPPGSAPGQVFRVRRLDPGVPLENLALRFRVVPGDPPAIAIETAGLELAGGRLSLADVLVDPGSRRQDLPLRVEGLDLAKVFALFEVEGLSGDGRLSGTIPLRVSDGVPTIAGGRLSAQGPGVLRVRSAHAKQALASAGESAELLLRALEDFRYEELDVTIEQPAENQALLGLSMLGRNPVVLEGHPFRFNINLETDPGKLLTTLGEIYRISDLAIRRMWMFRP